MKGRSQIKLGDRHTEPILLRSAPALVRAARDFPFGPAFVSNLWAKGEGGEGEESVPSLVVVVITRVAPWGALIPALALVDRTCVGVKKAIIGGPGTREELDEELINLTEAHGPIGECPLLVAQSVIFNAIDYAKTLGFDPHEDFSEPFFGPRPPVLLETPFSKPTYPMYIVSPGDEVESILDTLDSAVGSFNYSFMSPEPLSASGSVLAPGIDEVGEAESHASVAAG